ncbi:hypothetical protein GALMADRAFT_230518 [Galerina marginata CBS 339.88]|uniref:CoA transferase n=1 Tax=Galerina marginata (strain CBS 339.88) TaxID=685588 RepID=A0A067SG10_GALM3|nr:hypothetical protein GALMADRAFT_230518 [Galerina marginata CBS 339.88]
MRDSFLFGRQLIAGPFAGQLLGQFGAELINLEPPSVGNPLRKAVIDLHKPDEQELFRKLALKRVILENFQPGTLERWSLWPADSQRPRYASICEAEFGFRYINGYPDRQTGRMSGAPVRPNIVLGDSLQRDTSNGVLGVTGKTVVVSIVESGIMPEYDRKGKIRGPSGSSVTGIVPTNTYPCRPDSPTQITPAYVVIGGNGNTIYTYRDNKGRVARQDEIETAITAWTSRRTADEVIDTMNKASVPVGRVVSVKDIVGNEQFLARSAVRNVDLQRMTVKMQGNIPVIDGVDCQPTWAMPDLGTHTDQVLTEDLDLSQEEIHQLRRMRLSV